MLSFSGRLAVLYFGFAYIGFLVWIAVSEQLLTSRTTRWRQPTLFALVAVGVAHPVFALAAWDLARQAETHDDSGRRATGVERAGLAAATVSSAVAGGLLLFELA